MIKRVADLYNIRLFEQLDLPAMQQVRARAFQPIFESFRKLVGEEIYGIGLANSDQEQELLLESICKVESGGKVYVVTTTEKVIGFVSYSMNLQKRVGEIGLNAVDPDYAGRGVGALMYEFVIEKMRDAGMLLATVGTGGDASHVPARKAYQKVGFDIGLPSVFLYKRLR